MFRCGPVNFEPLWWANMFSFALMVCLSWFVFQHMANRQVVVWALRWFFNFGAVMSQGLVGFFFRRVLKISTLETSNFFKVFQLFNIFPIFFHHFIFCWFSNPLSMDFIVVPFYYLIQLLIKKNDVVKNDELLHVFKLWWYEEWVK